MPYNGAGIYQAPASSFNPAAANTTISVTDWNALLADITTALSTCLLKDGTQITTATIPFANPITVDKGSTGEQAVFGHTLKAHITENGSEAGIGHASATNTLTGVAFTATQVDMRIAGSAGLTLTGTGAVVAGAFGCNGKTAQGAAVSGGTTAGVIAALVANGILSS